MRWTSTLRIFVILAAIPALAFAETTSYSGQTIILFGADWCAPCVAELRDLPDLARAAAPDRMALAWTDRMVRISPEVRRLGVTQLSLSRARELLSSYGTGNSGLPLVVMLGEDRKPCAMVRRRLTTVGIMELRNTCAGAH